MSKDEVDIFSLNDYNIISKINKEIAIFIGINEEENECLAYNFYKTLENIMLSIVSDKLTKKQVLTNFENLVALIDEMVNEGIVMNTDAESLESRVNPKGKNITNPNTFISFNNVNNISTGNTGSLLGSLFSGAKSLFG